MNLYERDFLKVLTSEEHRLQNDFEKYDNIHGIKNTRNDPRHCASNFEDRKFLWCHNSLFPNNYLYHLEPANLDIISESNNFSNIIYKAINENEIQSYIKDNKKWFIPASIYKEYNFGHHGAYLFPELALGREYVVDYALLGKNSDGYNLVLIEFEKANVPFMISTSNSESESVRKGITQLRDWKRWFDDNRQYFMISSGFKEKGVDIPTSRIFYCLVVSRRDLMIDKNSKNLRSQLCYEMNNTKIISYDRLVDNIVKIAYGY